VEIQILYIDLGDMERKDRLDFSGYIIRLQVQNRTGQGFQQNWASRNHELLFWKQPWRGSKGWEAFRQEAEETSFYSWSHLEPCQVCATSNPTGCPQKTAKPSSLASISHATTWHTTLPRKTTSKQNKIIKKSRPVLVLLLLAGVN